MPANTRAFPNQTDRDIVERIFDTYVDYPGEYESLAKVVSFVGKGKGNHITKSFLSGIGAFSKTAEGAPFTYDEPTEGDKKSTYFEKWTNGLAITEEMIDDSLDNNFDQMAGQLSKNATYKKDAAWFDLLNSGFATHKSADGQYLFHATGHTTLKSNDTIPTRPATDVALGETGLQAAFEAFDKIKGESGNPIKMRPKWLVIPKELQWTASKLYKGTLKVGSMDNDINTVAPGNIMGGESWTPFKSLWLTSTTAWFLLSEDHDLEFIWRWPFRLQSSDDFNTGTRMYKATMRFKCDVWDYRGVYGTSGA